MPNIQINLSKWYHFIIASMPLVAALATSIMWVDTRYMHREISDTRFIELQIRIVQSQLRDWHRLIDNGHQLSAQEQMEFDLDKEQLKSLIKKRNKVLDLEGLPE